MYYYKVLVWVFRRIISVIFSCNFSTCVTGEPFGEAEQEPPVLSERFRISRLHTLWKTINLLANSGVTNCILQSPWEANSHSASQTFSLVWNPEFFTVFTRARYWPPSWARCIQSATSHPISLRSIRIWTILPGYCGTFRNKLVFTLWGVKPSPKPHAGGAPVSAVRVCLFSRGKNLVRRMQAHTKPSEMSHCQSVTRGVWLYHSSLIVIVCSVKSNSHKPKTFIHVMKVMPKLMSTSKGVVIPLPFILSALFCINNIYWGWQNRALRRIFGSKRDEVAGGWRRLHNEELRNLYASPNIVKGE
jgi:hypothetical protein